MLDNTKYNGLYTTIKRKKIYFNDINKLVDIDKEFDRLGIKLEEFSEQDKKNYTKLIMKAEMEVMDKITSGSKGYYQNYKQYAYMANFYIKDKYSKYEKEEHKEHFRVKLPY